METNNSKDQNLGFQLRSLNRTCEDPIRINSDQIYTVGRKRRHCDIVLENRFISKRHCQIFLSSFDRKLRLIDGFFVDQSSDLDEIRKRFRPENGGFESRVSSNGVFVNGRRVRRGDVVELVVGDEILLGGGVGFVVERIEDQVFDLMCHRGLRVSKAEVLLGRCRKVLESPDPISCLRSLETGDYVEIIGSKNSGRNENGVDNCPNSCNSYLRKDVEIGCCSNGKSELQGVGAVSCLRSLEGTGSKNLVRNENEVENVKISCCLNNGSKCLDQNDFGSDGKGPNSCNLNLGENVENGCYSDGKAIFLHRQSALQSVDSVSCSRSLDTSEHVDIIGLKSSMWNYVVNDENGAEKGPISGHSICYSDGKMFFLNRLGNMGHCLPDEIKTVTLPELLHPVESLVRVFMATFTSDVSWFLSYCQLPCHLPITIACHSAERCWSSSRESRTSAPYSYYPNLLLVYPPFPDVIAFGKDRKKRGVACHHPKLIVLQRKESMRVVVTSANLNSKQWNHVTNTVWWQDFPSRISPEYSALFCTLQDSNHDFAAQLGGFIASLTADVPSQAHWVTELTKYDFGGAVGHLVASLPGMHVKSSCSSETDHFALAKHIRPLQSNAKKFLGSVQVSVVGLSHRFCSVADSSGAQLKTLASFLGKFQENACGTLEVFLKRNINIPADSNAMSVFVADMGEFSEGDSVQLGFLPRDVAKWVSPLSDVGFFSFSAFIHPRETLAAVLDGSNTKVPLTLHVSQGLNFAEISRLIQQQHVAPLCLLLASIQRPLGLWRLQEVLSQYKWPESLETDFIYGSSSIGTSVNPQFIAAFSAAAGKRSVQLSESEESDPEWGCWTSNHELRTPSIRILFPTIERVKNGRQGIHPSRCLLSLSEKTWQRLRPAGIFHDAVPHPSNRLGYPMHVKVARRRFQSKRAGNPPFGWIYCGSHNFSPAAWGQIISPSSDSNVRGPRLHICNYELGIILIAPPSDAYKDVDRDEYMNIDDIVLPFVIPAPKYQCNDRPATAQAMREALAEAAILKKEILLASVINEVMGEDIPDEEEEEEEEEVEIIDTFNHLAKEEEKIYAEMLWSQLDSSGSGQIPILGTPICIESCSSDLM